MSPIRIHRSVRRLRRAALLPAVVLALGLAVGIHHGVPTMDHGDHGMDMGTVMEFCLGAFTAVGAAIVAVVIGMVGLGRWRPPLTLSPRIRMVEVRLPDIRARAGPAFLCVYRR